MPLYVTEYQTAASDQGRALPLGHGYPLANQVVNIGGSSVQSQPFTSRTHFIRLHTDGVCSILVGTQTGVGPPAAQNPVATTTCARMAQNQTEYMGVDPGMIVAVIANI
jgi:hypothetical protein